MSTATNTTEHLNAIKAKCHELLAIAEKRTPGRWWLDDPKEGGIRAESDHVLLRRGSYLDGADAAFIASSAGPFEASLRSTIAAIEYIGADAEIFAENCQRGQSARSQIQSILAAWPEEPLS